jgi:hypothetical protein
VEERRSEEEVRRRRARAASWGLAIAPAVCCNCGGMQEKRREEKPHDTPEAQDFGRHTGDPLSS